jgi:hypothetical protein
VALDFHEIRRDQLVAVEMAEMTISVLCAAIDLTEFASEHGVDLLDIFSMAVVVEECRHPVLDRVIPALRSTVTRGSPS